VADAVGGDLVVLAVPYIQAPHVVRQHADALGGKVVVDSTNPVDLGGLVAGDDADAKAVVAPLHRRGRARVRHAQPRAGRPEELFHDACAPAACTPTSPSRPTTSPGHREPVRPGRVARD
jgi:hypothetical protein